jgi:hypothetical protein
LPPQGALPEKLPLDGTLVLLRNRSVAAYPHKRLLFMPAFPSTAPLVPGFGAVDKLEFQEQNYSRAIELLRPMTKSPEALLRIARLEKRLNRPEQALADYSRLSAETAVNGDGIPYALLAVGARCALLPHGSAAGDLHKNQNRPPMFWSPLLSRPPPRTSPQDWRFKAQTPHETFHHGPHRRGANPKQAFQTPAEPSTPEGGRTAYRIKRFDRPT